MGLVSARGEAQLGVQGLLPGRRTPARWTSWSAPKPPVPASAPGSQPLRPNSGASRWVRCCCVPARSASSPAPSVPVLDSLGPHPQASPLCFCQRGSPTPSPFLGCAVLGPQEEAARASATGTHPGPRPRPLHKFLLGSGTPGPAGSSTADCSPPAAGGGEGSTGPGKDHARTRGVGVRQGGTALNALDSPAPTQLPPSSIDSWGLCFLHPPGGSRSAPTATRDSPSAVAAARLVHPSWARATTPFRGCGVETPARERSR